jgi:hypothetical protein
MKKLVLFSLIVALVSQVTGCIISSGDDTGDDDGGGGAITAHWDIKNVAKQSQDCPAGYDTAALYSQQIDVNYGNIGAPIVDLFDCTAFTAVSDPLPATTFYSWIQIESHDGSMVYASTVYAYIDLTTTDKVFSADIYTDGGYFQMAWQLTVGGVPSSCAANADITGVEAISTEVGNPNNAVSDIFKCGDHNGVTDVLPTGTYTISVDAFNSAMAAVGTAPTITGKSIGDQNQVTDLGTVTIPLD